MGTIVDTSKQQTMKLSVLLVFCTLYGQSSQFSLDLFLRHIHRRDDPMPQCYSCHYGAGAKLIMEMYEGIGSPAASTTSCFEPDQSVAQIGCNGRCMTVVLEAQGVDVNIYRTCFDSKPDIHVVMDISSIKVEATLVDNSKFQTLIQSYFESKVVNSYVSDFKPGKVSANIAYCGPTDSAVACDPPFQYPGKETLAMLMVSPPTECVSCWNGVLAQEFFRFFSEDASFVSLLGGELPYQDEDQCNLSTDQTQCTDHTCLAFVLEAPGADATDMKMCLPASSTAARAVQQFNPFSDATVQATLLVDFNQTTVRTLMEPMKRETLGRSIIQYTNTITAGKVTLKIIAIN